jgi:hypothetical protein
MRYLIFSVNVEEKCENEEVWYGATDQTLARRQAPKLRLTYQQRSEAQEVPQSQMPPIPQCKA